MSKLRFIISKFLYLIDIMASRKNACNNNYCLLVYQIGVYQYYVQSLKYAINFFVDVSR